MSRANLSRIKRQLIAARIPGELAHQFLDFTDLNAVMKAVQAWCDREDIAAAVETFRGKYWGNVGLGNRGGGVIETEPFDSHCHAMMAACVEAARKLKGQV